jgi:hypothetical protein
MEKIKKKEKKALTSTEMIDAMEGKANFLTYPELAEKKTLDEVLGVHDMCIILYLTKENYGHYCCLFRIGDVVTFFDSYGGVIDSQLKKIPEHFREDSNQVNSHLCRLLYESGHEVHYNDKQLQQLSREISTCGRHCISRLWLRHLDCDEYIKFFKGVNPDILVTLFTWEV